MIPCWNPPKREKCPFDTKFLWSQSWAPVGVWGFAIFTWWFLRQIVWLEENINELTATCYEMWIEDTSSPVYAPRISRRTVSLLSFFVKCCQFNVDVSCTIYLSSLFKVIKPLFYWLSQRLKIADGCLPQVIPLIAQPNVRPVSLSKDESPNSNYFTLIGKMLNYRQKNQNKGLIVMR